MNARPYCFVVVTSRETKTVKQRSGLEHVLRDILRYNPDEVVEVYELELRPEMIPTEVARERARVRNKKMMEKEAARKLGESRSSDERRLAALEEERELLRLRLGQKT